MNLKDRGVTVGDLFLILIFVFSTVFIVSNVKERNKQTYFDIVPNEILVSKRS